MTTKELSYINDVLTQTKVLIDKYRDYSTQVQDESLKNLCNQMATKHMDCYNGIYNQLNS
ncbi:hypothetical protein [Vallitalea guaymasensis]|mgnify:CR=1 FL=1|uniref:Spore coat protein n=1 Tax=Vallitalea guaymasensis TaxID=1185412 RepID=A0A8J8MEC0_9FIRM|nr:hypothetical protein [Vallitalea guaymasensis]QUH31308.1 hypothetical protein HYG85_21230 [Vallitalea guaymasensis]